MSIKLELPKLTDLKPRIIVMGIGGAGCNAVNNMISAGLTGVDFVVANTDAQALVASSAEHRIQLGTNLTEGLGAGSKPEIGHAAAEEAVDEIRTQISGAHMLFIAAGMGGGTGTGAASVVARIAKDLGVLTVAVVTKPFQFEGSRRMRIAEAGVIDLKEFVDTLIVIPNQNLFRIATDKTTFAEAFLLADQVLYSGIACIVDLIVKDGLINLDLADVKTVLSGMGTAMMGTGEATGERRAVIAAEEAIVNPLIDDVTLRGAKALLLSIIGGRDLTLYEVDEAASRVRQEVDPDANIIVGATFDESLGDRVRVSIVASGMARAHAAVTAPQRPPAPPVSQQQREQGSEDFHTRLSRAIEGEPPAIRPDARLPREWRGPADVVIEEGPPPFAGEPPRGFRPPPPPPQGDFRPAPPADIRRGVPRMPELDEFPQVGQRDYRSKKGIAGSESPRATRKPGLLERLTGGRGKRAAERSQAVEIEPRFPHGDDPEPEVDSVDLPQFFNKTKR
ncbi:MAG: cell division protein FtsZ [Hyphomicrobiaceae bacterium]